MNNEIVNFYSKVKKTKKVHNPCYKQTGIEIPTRILVIGCSGSGKTQWTLDFISRCKNTFTKIILSTRNVNEPLYQMLIEKLEDGIEVFEGDNLPDIENYKDNKDNILCIFDDFLELNKKAMAKIDAFAIRGRKYNLTCIFQSQSYYSTPRIVRMNSDYIVIKRINSERDLSRLTKEFSMGLDKEQLRALYNKAILNNGVLLFDVKMSNIRRNYLEILFKSK